MELPDNYRVTGNSINSSPRYVGFDNKRDDTVKKERVSLEEFFKDIMESTKQKNAKKPYTRTVYIDPSAKSTTISEDDYCTEKQFEILEQSLVSTAIKLLKNVKGGVADVEAVSMTVSLVSAINVLQNAKAQAGII